MSETFITGEVPELRIPIENCSSEPLLYSTFYAKSLQEAAATGMVIHASRV